MPSKPHKTRPAPSLRATLAKAAAEERDALVRQWLKALADKGEFQEATTQNPCPTAARAVEQGSTPRRGHSTKESSDDEAVY
jgi:hypothetical protein